jgi:hypothetical protein
MHDLNNVRNHFGGTGLGDTNLDGVVNIDDLNNVRNNFGTSIGHATAVPEPATWVLLAGAVFCLTAIRRRTVLAR